MKRAPVLLDPGDRVIFLPAGTAETGGVKARLRILGIEELAVEGDAAFAREGNPARGERDQAQPKWLRA